MTRLAAHLALTTACLACAPAQPSSTQPSSTQPSSTQPSSPTPIVSVTAVSAPPSSAPPRVVPQPARYRQHPLEARCYERAREARRAPPPAPSPAMVERLAGLTSACRDTHPELPPARFATTEGIPPPECHYGIARIHYHLDDYPEAARRFRRVVHDHVGSDVAPFAGVFYLQTLELLRGTVAAASSACADLMRQDAPAIYCMLCSPEEPNEDLCASLRRLTREAGAEDRCPGD